MRLKVVEESLKPAVNGTPRRTEEVRSASATRRPTSGSEEASKLLANGSRRQRSAVTQLRASMASQTLLRASNGRLTSKSFDGGRSLDAGTTRMKAFSNGFEELRTGRKMPVAPEPSPEPLFTAQKKSEVGVLKPDAAVDKPQIETPKSEVTAPKSANGDAGSPASMEDPVSGVLYDLLQKEVVNLRKASHEKDQSLKDKDDAIEVRFDQRVHFEHPLINTSWLFDLLPAMISLLMFFMHYFKTGSSFITSESLPCSLVSLGGRNHPCLSHTSAFPESVHPCYHQSYADAIEES